MAKTKKTEQQEPLEKQLWKAADKLRKNIDAAEYKHIALGLIFLKYISDSFEELFEKLAAGKGDYAGADPEGWQLSCFRQKIEKDGFTGVDTGKIRLAIENTSILFTI